MTNQTISPLRRRMIEDMTIRKFAPKTLLTGSSERRGPAALSASGLHGVSISSLNAPVTTLRFFFTVTLARAEAVAQPKQVSSF